MSLCKLIISFEVAVRLTDVGSGPAGRGGGEGRGSPFMHRVNVKKIGLVDDLANYCSSISSRNATFKLEISLYRHNSGL